jgi:hypothetical protein
MTTQRVWPGLSSSGTSLTVYAEDGVTLIPAAGGADVTLIQEQDGGPFVLPAYYRKKLDISVLLTHDPLGLSGDAVTVGSTTRVSGSLIGALVVDHATRSILSDRETFRVVGFSAAGDSGAGLEYRGVLNDTTTPDDFTVWEAPNGRWHLVWDGTTLPARAAGVKADGKVITDGVTTTSSAVLTSATAAFTQADVGKVILLETPSSPCTGTVTVSTSSTRITGSGTAFETECLDELSILFRIGSAGNNYYGGVVASDTDIAMDRLATSSLAGQIMYRETQLRTTILSVQSATQCTLADPIAVGGTNVVFRYGSDDTETLDAALTVAFDASARILDLPSGMICVLDNKLYTDRSGLHIRGAGTFETLIVDLRKLNEGIVQSGAVNHPYGLWDFDSATRLKISDLTFDGALPGSGLRGNSLESGDNIGGIRKGLCFFGTCSDITLENLGVVYHGMHEEHYYFEDTAYNVACRGFRCRGASNSNTLNFNSGNISAIVDDCELASAYTSLNSAAGELILSNSVFRGAPATTDTVAIDVNGRNTITNCRWEGIQMVSGTAPLSFFGTAADDAVLLVAGNRFEHFQCACNLDAGVISIHNFRGTADIYGNVTDGVYSDNSTPSQVRKFIYIAGASTGGKINIGNNVIRGRFLGSPYPGSWTGLNTGVYVHADVDDGVVSWTGKIACEGSVAAPVLAAKALSACGTSNLQQSIGVTGTTDVVVGARIVVVTFNGAVTARLPSATLYKGLEATVVNDSTQLGTTTVSAVAGSIVGSTSLVGAAAKATYISNGSKWLQVA